MNLDKIRWIASYPKSGNTWVRMFLEAYITGHLDINNLRTTKGDVSLIEHQQAACVPIDRVPENIALQYRSAALMNSLIRHGSNGNLFFKTHQAQTSVYGVPLIPPEISHSALYLVRDPRDIVPSWASHMGQTIDHAIFQVGADNTILAHDQSLKNYVGSWGSHVSSWENGIKTLRIRYEDLREDPFNGFGVVLEHFELPINKQRLGKALRLCELEKLKKQEKGKGFNEKLNRASPMFFGGKREVLTEKQKSKIEFDHGQLMTKLGYEVNTYGSNDKIRQLPKANIGGQP